MAFPIIPRKRSAASGNPTSLNLGELAVNTLTGELFLGADAGVTLLNGPGAAGTTTTERTGDGTTVAFTFTGYNGTDDNGYLVSVGGIDQPPSKYAVTSTAGGTITFVEAPTDGEIISIRAIVAGSGGGGSGDATSLQNTPIASSVPVTGNLLRFDGTNWAPFDGTVVANYSSTATYNPEDLVFYIGKIWQATTVIAGVSPNGVETGWVELVGVSNGAPQNTTTPVFWRYLNTAQGYGYIPIYQ